MKKLSRNELKNIVATLNEEGVIDRLTYFAPDFADGEHQLVVYLAETDDQPRHGKVVAEGWYDYTGTAEALNHVFNLESPEVK
ncbi:hypothetical protein VH22019_00056 [Vibrio phage VH2_2019]|nr:hypothetical protein VH22019_00056 [Vibrio phage VH2_2019]